MGDTPSKPKSWVGAGDCRGTGSWIREREKGSWIREETGTWTKEGGCFHLMVFFPFSIFLVLFFLFPVPSLFSLLFICHVLVFCVLVGSYVFCFIYLFLCLSSCCRRAGKMTREEREAALGRERKPGLKRVGDTP